MTSLRRFVASFSKGLAKIVGALVLLIAALFAFNAYKKYPVQEFCSKLSPSSTPEAVLALAESKGLLAYDAIQARGIISVLNQRSPFFRYACIVEFQDGRQVGKRVIAAD